jgi:hypothetical protein
LMAQGIEARRLPARSNSWQLDCRSSSVIEVLAADCDKASRLAARETLWCWATATKTCS